MGTQLLGKRTVATAVLAASACFASFCSAQETTTAYTMAGQGGYVRVNVTPAPAFALTGEQGLRQWQQANGPVVSVGNARIVLPAAR